MSNTSTRSWVLHASLRRHSCREDWTCSDWQHNSNITSPGNRRLGLPYLEALQKIEQHICCALWLVLMNGMACLHTVYWTQD